MNVGDDQARNLMFSQQPGATESSKVWNRSGPSCAAARVGPKSSHMAVAHRTLRRIRKRGFPRGELIDRVAGAARRLSLPYREPLSSHGLIESNHIEAPRLAHQPVT